jgi:hypothetical protein
MDGSLAGIGVHVVLTIPKGKTVCFSAIPFATQS